MSDRVSINTGIMNAINNRKRKSKDTGQPGIRDGNGPILHVGHQGDLQLRHIKLTQNL